MAVSAEKTSGLAIDILPQVVGAADPYRPGKRYRRKLVPSKCLLEASRSGRRPHSWLDLLVEEGVEVVGNIVVFERDRCVAQWRSVVAGSR